MKNLLVAFTLLCSTVASAEEIQIPRERLGVVSTALSMMAQSAHLKCQPVLGTFSRHWAEGEAFNYVKSGIASTISTHQVVSFELYNVLVGQDFFPNKLSLTLFVTVDAKRVSSLQMIETEPKTSNPADGFREKAHLFCNSQE